MRRCCVAMAWVLALLAVSAFAEGADSVSVFRRAVEADWLLQDRVRPAGVMPKRVSTRADALGAVDGKKDGKWGFHTGKDKQPWWHVDLGQSQALDRVVVFNRCDGGCPARTRKMEVLLSDDKAKWETVYRHTGPPFGGKPDGKPLVAKLEGKAARFVRLQLPHAGYFHLDEVEVYPRHDPKRNIALGKPADQSSASQWSVVHRIARSDKPTYPIDEVLRKGRLLVADLREAGVDIDSLAARFEAVADRAKALPQDAGEAERRKLYFEARWTVRQIALSNPLLDFDSILFAKRAPSSFSHMSDQYYGWWSRPGGGIFILTGFKQGEPKLRCLTPEMPTGNFLRPGLSHDGKRVMFAYCRYYPHVRGIKNKVDKRAIPDDAFYHVHEMNIDGTGLRQITRGRYDDFDARYLPDGRIVFLSTRRGQFIQCGSASAMATLGDPFLPDCYVRCGGGSSRPVAVYTLHVMDRDGGNLRAISPFENFEWTPAIGHDGRILYARWDYVDRHNMPYMSLWATYPDGSFPSIVYGNFTRKPHCIFEARPIPGSHKLMFTASAHHAITGGSICLLDPQRGTEGDEPLTRLTPEVRFPEIEGWPATFYANPFPLSERYYLVAWSPRPVRKQGRSNDINNLGVYLADAFGNLELIYRDPKIGSAYPIPLRSQPRPPVLPDLTDTGEGRMLLLNVYRGLEGTTPGAVKRLRIVGVPAKTQPQMNRPNLGATRDDPGKYVLGTVPVEPDGSAHFRVPAGVALLFQALDADGTAVQTMRTLTYVQSGQTASCIGCHEPRTQAPPSASVAASQRPPSLITPGPEGSWPLRFDRLVQPVLDRYCVRCHSPKGNVKACKKLNLSPAKSYQSLAAYGKPSLHDHVRRRYREGRSLAGACSARTSKLLAHLRGRHQGITLDADAMERLVTWIDTYGQRLGSFSKDQEKRLVALRERMKPLLAKRQ